MKDGVYTARRLVLISGDKGFRDVVDDLRSKEMVVYFIKPERNVCAPLTSGAQSIYLSEGKYNNWHIVAKTRSEKVQDRKRARKERMHLERQVGRMAIGEGFETEFKQTDHGKEILRRDPSFSLNDFADKVHDNINRVLSAYTKVKSCFVQLWFTVNHWLHFCVVQIVGISEANVQEAKMMGTTPTIIVRFKTKEIFRVSNKKGTTHSEQDHQWTMQQTDAWEWSLSDIGK
ncbi:hypothetical protein Bca4012_088332 [Brassica carinata]